MSRRLFGELCGSVSGLTDGLLGLLRGVPKLTPEQERCIAEMEKDYEQLLGSQGDLPGSAKKLETETRPDGHQ